MFYILLVMLHKDLLTGSIKLLVMKDFSFYQSQLKPVTQYWQMKMIVLRIILQASMPSSNPVLHSFDVQYPFLLLLLFGSVGFAVLVWKLRGYSIDTYKE